MPELENKAPESVKQISRPAPGWVGAQWLLVAWAFGLVFYMLHKEGLINWAWIERPEGAGPFDLRLEPSERRGVYLEVLKNLAGPWRIWWDNIPWVDLGIATGMALLYLLAGWFVLGCFEIYVPAGALLALSLTMGIGTAGVAFELLTLTHFLRWYTVAAVWVLLLVIPICIRELRLRRKLPNSPIPEVSMVESLRARQAQDWERISVVRPGTLFEKLVFVVAAAMIAVISALVFIHAVAEPETYWDSLILYMGFARKIFLEHGFPEKVVGQVGIGLGANYPHLYSLLTAQTATVAGRWSDTFAQVLPPMAGVASTMLVYYTVRDLWGNMLCAMLAALVFCAVPLEVIYSQYASNYAFAVLFTAAFLYLAARYFTAGHWQYLALMLATAAFAVHVNYLMWALWIAAAVVIVAAHWGVRQPKPEMEANFNPAYDYQGMNEPTELPAKEMQMPEFLKISRRHSLARLLGSRRFLMIAVACLAVASPWYLRNIIVTGNPVYAFFSNIFPSKNVNPEVMKSAGIEWLLNGDGLGKVGRTLPQKLGNSWLYFVTGAQSWKMGPFFMAFVIPGFLVWLVLSLKRTITGYAKFPGHALRFGLAAAALFVLLWFYAYVVADYYLYQIIIVVPLFGVFFGFLYQACSNRGARAVLCGLVLITGFAPGIIMAMMGFKLLKSGTIYGGPFSQIHLTALRNPFMNKRDFYRMQYNGDMDMFDRLTWLTKGTKLLTHENRHLLLDERINIIHLDDWEVQPAFRRPVGDRMRILDGLEIGFYLYVPNEDKHRVNSLVGMDELIQDGYFEEVGRFDAAGSSTREGLDYKVIPADKNVLYMRTEKQVP
ncbi:MAG: glycosyltransferase family 39 protein [Candidatus Sumerlaeaceae bacterium]|nr:glycosyltransferase family 39 protein [Candidatus Sumerlaeaceae bacterium]